MRRALVILSLATTLAACGGRYRAVADTPVTIGRPYQVRGTTYVPAAAPDYDAVGIASWYGDESGDRTARGEKFRRDWLTAAHPTLPLPSYLEVTALDTGRTIVVRVNDRGPFTRARILDLSRGAARALGLHAAGHGAVHVRLTDPPERDRDRLRQGKPAAPRPDATPAQLADWRARLAAARR